MQTLNVILVSLQQPWRWPHVAWSGHGDEAGGPSSGPVAGGRWPL